MPIHRLDEECPHPVHLGVDRAQRRVRPGFRDRLLAEGDGLAAFAYRGRQVPGTELRELVAVHPYVIRYRIMRDAEVQIVRVRHASRRPTTP